MTATLFPLFYPFPPKEIFWSNQHVEVFLAATISPLHHILNILRLTLLRNFPNVSGLQGTCRGVCSSPSKRGPECRHQRSSRSSLGQKKRPVTKEKERRVADNSKDDTTMTTIATAKYSKKERMEKNNSNINHSKIIDICHSFQGG